MDECGGGWLYTRIRDVEGERERERERARETLLGVSRDARDQMLRADLDLIEKIPVPFGSFLYKKGDILFGIGSVVNYSVSPLSPSGG